MVDIKFVRANPSLFRKLLQRKNIKLDLDKLLELDNEKHELLKKSEKLRNERNQNTQDMKTSGGKPSDALISKGKSLREEIKQLEEKIEKLDKELLPLLYMMPNIISEDTPIGPDESGNKEVRRWYKKEGGDPPKFDFEFKDHIELGKSLDLLDLERGVKTSGFRGYYLKNEGALMHLGLMQYGIEKMISHGFTPMITPTIVREEALFGSGHFPFDEENIYTIDSLKHQKDDNEEDKEKKFLAGTAEPSLLYYYGQETIEEDMLPIKFVGFSPCYRSEIGSYGKDTKGIYRIHEFFKIEQVVICKNTLEEAESWHQKMLNISEEILQELEIPYRVLQICSGDMGAGKYKMYDIESWMPSRDSFGETHSASNLLDWQARRLNTKVKGKNGKSYFPYMLNNTVLASPRILIAIWENYQQKDGSIGVPKVLQKYLGADKISKK